MSRGKIRAGFILLAVGLGVLCWFHLGRLTPDRIFFTNDAALSFAIADRLLAGEPPLLGPPSHAGGRHVGPLYYGYVALALFFSAHITHMTVLLFTVMKILAVLVTAAAAALLGKGFSRFWLAFFTLCAFFAGMNPWVLQVPWHSNFLLIPAAVFIFLCFLCFAKGMHYLPLIPLSASILFQTNIASILVIISSAVILALGYRYSTSPVEETGTFLKKNRSISSILLILAGLSWLPTLIYEFRYPSNIKALFHLHMSAVKDEAGFTAALKAVGKFIKRFTFGDAPFSVLLDPLPDSVLALILLSAVIVLLSAARRGGAATRWCLSFTGLTFFAYTLFLSRIEEPVLLYYMHSAIPFCAILLGVIITWSGKMLFLSAGTSLTKIRVYGEKAAALVVLLAVSWMGYRSISHNNSVYRQAPYNRVETLQHAVEVKNTLNKEGISPLDRIIVEGPGPRGISWLRENAYYYNLGPGFYRFMTEGEKFRELETFRGGQDKAPGRYYLLRCGQPPGAGAAGRLRAEGYREVRTLPLETGETCRGCVLMIFAKRTAPLRRHRTHALPDGH